jgi:DNA-binding response OmpR family regulator
MKKVLVVEDQPRIFAILKKDLQAAGFEVERAMAVEHVDFIAKKCMKNNKFPDAILWDGQLGDGDTYKGSIQQWVGKCSIMIAMSRDWKEQQIGAGCTHAADKEGVVKLVISLLS